MRTLIWSKTFLKTFNGLIKKRPDKREEIEKTLRLLVDDPFNPKLEAHKLKGKLSGTWACSVGYDLRIIFDTFDGAKPRFLNRGNNAAQYQP